MAEYMLCKRDFARLLGIAEQQYFRYENSITNPSLEVATKIALALNREISAIWHLEKE